LTVVFRILLCVFCDETVKPKRFIGRFCCIYVESLFASV
jgi:hypothetical protein